MGTKIIVMLSVGFVILASVLTGCSPSGASGDITNLPPSYSPDKGNLKLDSQLNQLVLAEKRGEVASFAEKNNIELTDGRVRVIIECAPGKLEAATQAATSAGAKLETSYDNLLQVSVPVTSLSTLAGSHRIMREKRVLPM
jgi:hypothetical protein